MSESTEQARCGGSGSRLNFEIEPHRETLALMQAAQAIRSGCWFSGAPSHVFAELAKALNELDFCVAARPFESEFQHDLVEGEADEQTN